MSTFHHFETAACLVPDQWRKELWPDAASDELPLVLDAVETPAFTRIFCPGHTGIRITKSDQAATLGNPEIVPREQMLGGYFIDVENAKIKYDNKNVTLKTGPISVDLFDGLNTLFAIEYNPDPDDLADWLEFNIKNSGAQAALVIRRVPAKSGETHKLGKIKRAVEGIEELKCFVLLDYSIPIGAAGEIAASERLLAPEAPGKALLERPDDDIWRAPLGQFGIYLAARYRFLSKARAVLHCSIADLVTNGENASNIFDIAEKSEGYIKIRSRFAYIWKIEKTGNPSIRDHSCKRFDSAAGTNIWCARPSLEGVWRPFRASRTPPEFLTIPPIAWHCVSIKHKHLKVSEVVPKSSLIPDDELIAIQKKTLKAAPTVPPPAEDSPKDLKNERILVVTTMKDEGPFILEWLAYHRSIGVTDFLVYTNDCSDGTDEMFDLLHSKGIVEHRSNPYRSSNLKPQHAAYHDASESEIASKADWVMCMDVDEYINIHVGDGTLHDLFAAVGDANIISMTWRLFGNAELVDFKDKFITEQFFRCAPKFIRKPHQAWGFKTMFRPLGYYKKYGVHRPKGLRPEALGQVKWVNGSGIPMPPKLLRNGWRSSSRSWGYALVTLNHYALRSAESYLVKRFRGRVNHVNRDQGENYWFRMNNNATHDDSILNKLPAAKVEFDKFMADPDIRAMHEKCVAAHRKKIKTLLESPDYKALFDEVTGQRLNRLSQMHHHMGSQVFMDWPNALDAEFHERHQTFDENQPMLPNDTPAPRPAFYKPK